MHVELPRSAPASLTYFTFWQKTRKLAERFRGESWAIERRKCNMYYRLDRGMHGHQHNNRMDRYDLESRPRMHENQPRMQALLRRSVCRAIQGSQGTSLRAGL